MLGPAKTRVARAASAAVITIAALAVVVGGLARVTLDTGLSAFLPSHDATVQGINRVANDFGGDPVVVLLETAQPHALFTDHDQLLKLLELEGKLAKLNNVAVVYGPATVLNQTAGAAQNMLAELSGRRDGLQQLAIAAAKKRGLSDAEANAIGQTELAAFDKRYAPLLVEAMPAGLPTLSNPRFVSAVLFDTSGNPRPLWRYIVPQPNAVAVLVRPRSDLDQTAAGALTGQIRSTVQAAGLRLSRTTVTGIPAVGAALTQRVRGEAPILGAISVLVVGGVFVLAGWTRRRRSRLRPIIAALVGSAVTAAFFGWVGRPLSLGVVAFLPILLGIGSDFPLYLTLGGRDRRVLAAAGAAVVGFLSLAISPLPFVRELGIALAIGLCVTVLTSWLLRARWGTAEPTHQRSTTAPRHLPPAARWGLLGAAVSLALVGWIVLPGLKIEADPQKLAQGLPEVDAATYAGHMLRSDGEIAIELAGSNVATPTMLEWQQKVETEIVRSLGDAVHPIVSGADLFAFLGAKPTQGQFDSAVQLMPRYLTSSVLRTDGKAAIAEYGVQFTDVSQLAPVLAQIRQIISHPPTGTQASVVGIPVAAVRGLDLVGQGRLWMNLVGIVGAVLALLLGLRHRDDALRAGLTVLIASGWVALLAWLISGELNPLTVAVGSLITATGCEFTIMLSRNGALRPVLTAAIAGTLGYLIIAFSELAMLKEFGLLLASGVLSSLVAALLVTRIWPSACDRAASADGHDPLTREKVLA